jgi:hypothetical protein
LAARSHSTRPLLGAVHRFRHGEDWQALPVITVAEALLFWFRPAKHRSNAQFLLCNRWPAVYAFCRLILDDTCVLNAIEAKLILNF